MAPSVSSKTQLTRVERTWRFSCRARDRVIGPFIVCIEVMSSSPSSYSWSFFLSAPAGHPGFHVTGLQLRLPSAVSATSFCCSHYCLAVSMTTSDPAAPAAQPQSESVPAPASTADPRSKTDSDPQLVFALLPRPRPDAPPPPPPTSDVVGLGTLLVFDAKGGEI
jgi:hypothetical protein